MPKALLVLLLATPAPALAVCATRDLPRGVALTRADVMACLGGDLGEDEVAGQTLLRPLRQGAAVRRGLLAPPLLVRRGDRVEIVEGGEGFEISSGGAALEDGGAGAVIRVTGADRRHPRRVKIRPDGRGVPAD